MTGPAKILQEPLEVLTTYSFTTQSSFIVSRPEPPGGPTLLPQKTLEVKELQEPATVGAELDSMYYTTRDLHSSLLGNPRPRGPNKGPIGLI